MTTHKAGNRIIFQHGYSAPVELRVNHVGYYKGIYSLQTVDRCFFHAEDMWLDETTGDLHASLSENF